MLGGHRKELAKRKTNENSRIINAITKFVHLKNKNIADLKGEKAKETIKEFMKNRKAVIYTRNNITYENIEKYYESIDVQPGNAKITQLYQEIHTSEPANVAGNMNEIQQLSAEEKIRELMPRNKKKNRSEKLVKEKKRKLKHRQETRRQETRRQETSKKRVKRINESE